MMQPLKHLTVKPTHACTHHCPYCASRRALLRASRGALSVDDWARVFEQGEDLGVEYLDISGGEPVLYAGLPGLVWEAKRKGWFVSLNATGRGLPAACEALETACLDQVIVSLLSLDPSRHDELRATRGSWQDASQALERLQGSSLRVILHVILSRQNYTELPALIDYAFARGVNGMALVYPEDDARARHLLMTDPDVERVRTEVLPECLRRYAAYRPHPDASHRNLAGLFGADGCDYASGTYWLDLGAAQEACTRPETFALIYPNGDVLPCNGVEYTHEPIVGNVLQQDLRTIWEGDAYARFRATKTGFCRLCPSKRHTGIAIRTTNNPPYAAPVVRQVPARLPASRPTEMGSG